MNDRPMAKRKTLPPRPPPYDGLRNALRRTRMYDPNFEAPAPEGRQQLIISALSLTNHRHVYPAPERLAETSPEVVHGRRLLIHAQTLKDAANGRRQYAKQWFWPLRGVGAGDGGLQLSMLDKFFARVLGHIPRPGTLELSELIGLNFMSTVLRRRAYQRQTGVTQAYFQIERIRDCCALPDKFPSYPPTYTEYEWEHHLPAELEGVKL